MKLLILGFGNIARNLLRILEERKEFVKRNYRSDLEVIAIADSKNVYSGFKSIKEVIDAAEKNTLNNFITKEMKQLQAIKTMDYDILVEVTTSTPNGEPGISYVKGALEMGKDVVTANKGILVNNFDLIYEAKSKGNIFKFESTVCGSIPVFSTIDNYYSKAKIHKIEGAFNATSSYVSRIMEEGHDFNYAIEKAIRDGIAERNYKDDILGVDSARKALILHNYVFDNKFTFGDININVKESDLKPGMGLLSELTKDDITIRYVKKSEKGKIFDFNGPGMSFSIRTDLFNQQTIVVESDGPKESAAAVYSDILDIMKVRS